MPHDPRIDALIQKAPPFAQPILKELRKRLHAACPTVEETLKWNMPAFLYKNKILAGMAAFKQHCFFGFWHPQMHEGGSGAMGQFRRIITIKDLPSATAFAKLVKKAMKLTDENIPTTGKKRPTKRTPLQIPPDLRQALAANPRAQKIFDQFSYSHRKEYIQWITEAKREETRTRRLKQAISQIAQGKSQNWKYER